jgi:hypothetical protein
MEIFLTPFNKHRVEIPHSIRSNNPELKGREFYHMVTCLAKKGDENKVFQYFGKRMGKGKRIMPVTKRIFFLDIHCTQKAYKKKYRSGALWKWWDVVLQEWKGVWTCHVYCKEFLTPSHPYGKKISAFMRRLLHLADFFFFLRYVKPRIYT